MKSYLRSLTLLAAILALALPSTTFAETFHFKGQTASVEFYSYDPISCITTSVYVFATESRYHTPPGSPTDSGWASFNYGRWNPCTGEILACADGYFTPPDDALQVSGHLASGTFNAGFEAYDCYTGAAQPASVSITMVGEGDVIRGTSHNSYSSPGYRVRYRSNGQLRYVLGTGSLTLGGSEIPLENGYGDLSQVNSGTISHSSN